MNYFCEKDISNLILDKTNDRISNGLKTQRQNKTYIFESSKYTCLRETSFLKIRALIGLLYIRELHNMNQTTSSFKLSSQIKLGYQYLGYYVTSANKIFSFITFDNYQERQAPLPDNHFLWIILLKLLKIFFSNSYLFTDETISPMCH